MSWAKLGLCLAVLCPFQASKRNQSLCSLLRYPSLARSPRSKGSPQPISSPGSPSSPRNPNSPFNFSTRPSREKNRSKSMLGGQLPNPRRLRSPSPRVQEAPPEPAGPGTTRPWQSPRSYFYPSSPGRQGYKQQLSHLSAEEI